ncbi:MAG: PAS domain-containing sensor histidine kinase [bacterium]
MENKVSEILKLICKITNGTYAYVLNSIGNEFVVTDSWAVTDISPRDLKLLNVDITAQKRLDEIRIRESESFAKLSSRYSIKAVKTFVVTSAIEYKSRTLLVVLFLEEAELSDKQVEEIEIINRLLLEAMYEKDEHKNDIQPEFASSENDIKNLDAAYLIVDKDGIVVSASRKFLMLSGYADNSLLVHLNDIKFYSAENEAESYDFNFSSGIFSVVQGNYTLFLATASNNKKLVNINVISIARESADINKYLFLFSEQASIRSEKDSIKELADNLDLVLYSITPDLKRYIYMSGAVEKIFGFKEADIIKDNLLWLRNINPAHFEKIKTFLRNLKNGNKSSVDYEFVDKKRSKKYLRQTGIPIYKNGKIVHVLGTVEDITQQKNLLVKMEQSEERFRLLIETADDLIFNLNKYGYFISVNNNGALALGYRSEEVINKHFLEFVNENGKADIAVSFQKILRTSSIVTFEAELLDKFGNSIVFDIQARPIKADGEISGMLGIGRNITKRRFDENKLKDLNDKLIEANRIISIERDRAKQQIVVLEEINKLKNEFISNVSHELRTPLASIVGFAETIDSDPNLPIETVKEFNQIILNEGKRLAKLINEILDFSKLEAGSESLKVQKLDINFLMRELTESFGKLAEEKSLTLTANIPETEIFIRADRDRLKKAVSHIISNAIKFTKKGGRVTVIAQDFLNEVEIAVSDTGVGIPETDLPNIFQKFKKIQNLNLQTPGAGFGLVSVKQIIDLHKGVIRVNSEVGKGTTFILKLPKNN